MWREYEADILNKQTNKQSDCGGPIGSVRRRSTSNFLHNWFTDGSEFPESESITRLLLQTDTFITENMETFHQWHRLRLYRYKVVTAVTMKNEAVTPCSLDTVFCSNLARRIIKSRTQRMQTTICTPFYLQLSLP